MKARYRSKWRGFLQWGVAIACLLWGFAANSTAAIPVEIGDARRHCTPIVAPATLSTESYVAPDLTPFPPFEGSLATGNRAFHEIYEGRICQTIESFGTRAGPVALLIIGDEAIVYRNDRREIISGLSPDLYHALKAIGHQALAFQLTARSQPEGDLQAQTRLALEAQLGLLPAIAATYDAEIAAAAAADASAGRISNAQDWIPAAQTSAREILQATTAQIEIVLANAAIAPDDLAQYRQAILPAVVAGANLAAAAQLTALNTQLSSIWEEVQGQEVYVAIAGAHQPRAGEVSMQYFSRVLGELPEIGALGERHLVYAEGQFAEADLLGTLARHILDREIGTNFFRDPTRMQRDLLGDAATQWLWQRPSSIPRLEQ